MSNFTVDKPTYAAFYNKNNEKVFELFGVSDCQFTIESDKYENNLGHVFKISFSGYCRTFSIIDNRGNVEKEFGYKQEGEELKAIYDDNCMQYDSMPIQFK